MIKKYINKFLFFITTLFFVCLFPQVLIAGKAIQISDHDKALMPVIISSKATSNTRQIAGKLADYLKKISGASFNIANGNGRGGIAIGVFSDFPKSVLITKFNPDDPKRREEYFIHTHNKGIQIIGATEMAVEHAVWDFLYHLGHRQFFPGVHWEIVPQIKNVTVDIDLIEQPHYYSRRIWYGNGFWDYNKDPYLEWCRRNRVTSGISIKTGHAYQGIIGKNQNIFSMHPEYLGLVNGKRSSSKLCISNPGLRKLVVDYAIGYFQDHPEEDSISMEPSDGGGWCECDNCAKLGSISTRAVFLANEVAEAVNKKYKNKYVGMYAYHLHSPPPGIAVHPNVVISVATAFIKGGYTVQELMAGWKAKGATIGIREYYGLNVWDRDMPGGRGKSGGRAGNLEYIKSTIPGFYSLGARFFTAESGDNWGPNGLGYYLASRILWNTDEAKRIVALKNDFFEKCFGPAKGPMIQFYALLDETTRPPLNMKLVRQMYDFLATARGMSNDAGIKARIDDLILYTRYVELFLGYQSAHGLNRQKAFEEMIKYAYRIRKTMMIHVKSLYKGLEGKDKRVSVPENAKWDIPEGENPWKLSTPLTEKETLSFLSMKDH